MGKRVLLFTLVLITASCFAQEKDVVFWDQRINFTSEPVPQAVLERMAGKSLPEQALIHIGELRYLTIPYYDFNGNIQTGEMVCNKAIAHDLLLVFSELFQMKYPINSIKIIDDFDGSDDASMEANNTSCFNYRSVPGMKHLSRHAMGKAVDINPVQNPWVSNKKVYPPSAEEYADRSKDFPHKIDHDDACYRIMKAHGFFWGGDWARSKDYQHFYK